MSDNKQTTPAALGVFGEVFDKSETVRRWLGMSEGKPYYNALREWQAQLRSQLQRTSVDIEVFRAQGALDVLDRLLGLREELN